MRFNHIKTVSRSAAFVLVCIVCSMTSAFAQQTGKGSESAEPQKSRKTALDKTSTTNSGGVIQLEAVIRGNQQQPKVLTIVPWQSPERRNALPSPVWQQVRQQLQPLERREFLQEQRLFEKLSK
jgi:hypothetical protein